MKESEKRVKAQHYQDKKGLLYMSLDKLMKDIGVKDHEELINWIEENPDKNLAKDFKELFNAKFANDRKLSETEKVEKAISEEYK